MKEHGYTQWLRGGRLPEGGRIFNDESTYRAYLIESYPALIKAVFDLVTAEPKPGMEAKPGRMDNEAYSVWSGYVMVLLRFKHESWFSPGDAKRSWDGVPFPRELAVRTTNGWWVVESIDEGARFAWIPTVVERRYGALEEMATRLLEMVRGLK